jgi:hypothetical protein
MEYPVPIREIHQVELTTHCNLRCRYCPSPKMPRVHEHMTWDTFLDSMKLVKYYCDQVTQNELALTGIGEPTMHPQFIDMVAIARETIGLDRFLTVSTNGITFTEKIAQAAQKYNLKVFVSLHRPEKAGPAIELAKKYGVFGCANASPATSSFDWAGQVNWQVSSPRYLCEYLKQGWGVIMADGRVTTCCLDADGAGVIGTVKDDPSTLRVKPYKHCEKCHMIVPE